jgi:serine/threonine protein kinase
MPLRGRTRTSSGGRSAAGRGKVVDEEELDEQEAEGVLVQSLAKWLEISSCCFPPVDALAYAERLCELGFEDADSLIHDIAEADLQGIGMKPGHIRRLLRVLSDERGMDKKEPHPVSSYAHPPQVLRCMRCTVICVDDEGQERTFHIEPGHEGEAGFYAEPRDSSAAFSAPVSPALAEAGPLRWGPVEVGSWLGQFAELAQYRDMIVSEGIDGRCLLGVTSEIDAGDLGIVDRAHRLALLREVALLRQAALADDAAERGRMPSSQARQQQQLVGASERGKPLQYESALEATDAGHVGLFTDLVLDVVEDESDVVDSGIATPLSESIGEELDTESLSPQMRPWLGGSPPQDMRYLPKGSPAMSGSRASSTRPAPVSSSSSKNRRRVMYTEPVTLTVSSSSRSGSGPANHAAGGRMNLLSSGRPGQSRGRIEVGALHASRSQAVSTVTGPAVNAQQDAAPISQNKVYAAVEDKVEREREVQQPGNAADSLSALRLTVPSSEEEDEGNHNVFQSVSTAEFEGPLLPSAEVGRGEALALALSMGGLDGTLNNADRSYEFSEGGTLRIGDFILKPHGIMAAPLPPPSSRPQSRGSGGSGSPITPRKPGTPDNPRPRSSGKSDTPGSSRSVSTPPDSRLTTPRRIQESTILLEELGRGAGGTVYKGLHLASLRLVAVKIVAVHDDNKRHAIVRELRALHSISLVRLKSPRQPLPSRTGRKQHRLAVSTPRQDYSSGSSMDEAERTSGDDDGESSGDETAMVVASQTGTPPQKARSRGGSDKRGQVRSGEVDTEVKRPCRYIVAFHDAYTDPEKGSVCMVMEYMDAGTLQQFVKRKQPLGEAELAAVARGVLKGLAAMHAQHKIHRDIKPSNILLDHRGVVKISDFGIARELTATFSVASTFTGTLSYMSPERINGLAYSYPSDIWSLGLVVATLATGHFPFMNSGGGYWEVVQAIQEGPPPLLTNGDFSPEACDFVNCMLKKDPNERPSARQLLSHPFLKRCRGVGRKIASLVNLRDQGAGGDGKSRQTDDSARESLMEQMVFHQAALHMNEYGGAAADEMPCLAVPRLMSSELSTLASQMGTTPDTLAAIHDRCAQRAEKDWIEGRFDFRIRPCLRSSSCASASESPSKANLPTPPKVQLSSKKRVVTFDPS